MNPRPSRRVGRPPRGSGGAPNKRERILQVAERLFAGRGFRGTTMREIADAAQVVVSVVVYHFKTKQDLYRALFERRRDVFERRVNALRQITDFEAGDALERIIAAFVMPILDLEATREGRNYALLTAHETFDPEEDSRGVVRDYYDPLAREFIKALQRALPDKTMEDVHWSYLFSVGALMIAGFDERIARLSENRCRTGDLPAKTRRLVAYVAAGIRNGPAGR